MQEAAISLPSGCCAIARDSNDVVTKRIGHPPAAAEGGIEFATARTGRQPERQEPCHSGRKRRKGILHIVYYHSHRWQSPRPRFMPLLHRLATDPHQLLRAAAGREIDAPVPPCWAGQAQHQAVEQQRVGVHRATPSPSSVKAATTVAERAARQTRLLQASALDVAVLPHAAANQWRLPGCIVTANAASLQRRGRRRRVDDCQATAAEGATVCLPLGNSAATQMSASVADGPSGRCRRQIDMTVRAAVRASECRSPGELPVS